MEEVYDRCGIMLTAAALPYTLFQNAAVRDFQMCLGDLRGITNKETFCLALHKLGSNYKMNNKVDELQARYKLVSSINDFYDFLFFFRIF